MKLRRNTDALEEGIRVRASEAHYWVQVEQLVESPEFLYTNFRVLELRGLTLSEAAKSISDSPLGSLQGLCPAARGEESGTQGARRDVTGRFTGRLTGRLFFLRDTMSDMTIFLWFFFDKPGLAVGALWRLFRRSRD
jgi:hypothetical protein